MLNLLGVAVFISFKQVMSFYCDNDGAKIAMIFEYARGGECILLKKSEL
jgi:hypothetical protein